MAHLACVEHSRRVVVFHTPKMTLPNFEVNKLRVQHRQDGSDCDSRELKIGPERLTPLHVSMFPELETQGQRLLREIFAADLEDKGR
jgi:hypothetical protein